MKNTICIVLATCILATASASASVPPSNDFWTNPTPLSGEDIEISGNNAFASDAGPEYYGEHGVWYKWSPTAGTAFEILTDGSSFDTYLALYRQNSGSFGGLDFLEDNDDRDASTTASAIRIKLFPTVDYRILVGSKNFGDTGDFKLRIKRLFPPPNDTIEGAMVMTGDFPIIFDENTPATQQEGENGDGLWYRWIATQDATYRITTGGSESFTNLTVFSGNSPDSLTELVYADDAEGGSNFAASADLTMSAGTQYWFLVANPFSVDSGPLQLSLGIPPANDLREAAIDLPQSAPMATGDNRGAERHNGEFGYHGLWYKWNPPQDGGYSFATVGSEIDTLLVVHVGDSPDNLDRLGINDNDRNNDTVTSRLDLNLLAAETYWIAVSASDEGDFGEVRIRIDPIPAPPNDSLQMASELSGQQITERSNINGASTDAGERGSYGVWYKWSAPQSGPTLFSTARSSFNTLLTVFSGSVPGNLSELAFNDESPENPDNNFRGVSSLVLTVEQETTYWIQISGADEFQSGNFALGINPVPDNDTPANAVQLTGLDPEFEDNNTGAVGSPDENGVHSVWYRWTAPMSREYKIQMRSDDFDTILTVYEGPNADSLVELGSNDNDWDLGINDWGSGLTILGEEGKSYWFQASAKFEGQTGRFTISIVPGVFPQTLEEWLKTELADFGITTNNGPMDDYDEDGLIHLVEYAFGLNPRGRDPHRFVRMNTSSFGDEDRIIMFYERRKAATAPGLSYRTQFSGDQVNWSGENNDEFVESLNSVWEEVRVEPDETPDGKFKTGRVLVSMEP